MVKNFLSILLSFLLILGASIFETKYLEKRFQAFYEVLEVLYEKSERKTATEEDGKLVQSVWEEQKKTLHILIPHTSISAIDSWLSEARGYLQAGDYEEVLPKARVLLDLCVTIPHSYMPFLENIL